MASISNQHWLFSVLALALVSLAFSACATVSTFADDDAVVAEAQDVPDRFLVGSYNGEERQEPDAGEGCRSPLVDPRDDTQIVMVRSSHARADYEVPEGRYGVGSGQLLRVNCDTGRVLGIVRR